MMIRSLMIVLALTFAAGNAFADSKDDVLRAMAKCANTSGKKARLKCFDQASPALRALFPNGVEVPAAPLANAAPAAAPVPSVSTPQAPPNAVAAAQPTEEQKKSWFGLGTRRTQTTPEQFGSENVPQPKPAEGAPPPPEEIEKIVASLTDYATTPLGSVVIFLDNGQVWRQSESDGTKVYFKKKMADNTVVISRGPLGSYSMRVNNHGSIVKVTRVK